MSAKNIRVLPLIVAALLLLIEKHEGLAAPAGWVGQVAFRPGSLVEYCTLPSGKKVKVPTGKHVGHVRVNAFSSADPSTPSVFQLFISPDQPPRTVLISSHQDLVEFNSTFEPPEMDVDVDPCGTKVTNDIEYYTNTSGGEQPCWKVNTSNYARTITKLPQASQFFYITTFPDNYATIVTLKECTF
jgi:hypothetical protein